MGRLRNGAGRGAAIELKRAAPLPGELDRSLVGQARVGPGPVVVVAPVRQHGSCAGQRGKEGLFEALIPQSADEALGKGVLLRLFWRDVVQFDGDVVDDTDLAR